MTSTKLLIGQMLIVSAVTLAGIWFAAQWAAAELGSGIMRTNGINWHFGRGRSGPEIEGGGIETSVGRIERRPRGLAAKKRWPCFA